MEDSESAKKQENTGIGPASACRGESAFTRPKRVHARLSCAMARPRGAERSTRTFLSNLRLQETIAGSPRLFPACYLQGTLQPQRVEPSARQVRTTIR